MRRWMAVLVFCIAACAPAAPPAAHTTVSPANTAYPSASASPAAGSTTSPSATPTFADLPLTTLGFSCRLPIYLQGTTIVDGFIGFPSGAMTLDPHGNQGMYYDRAFSRWLPVPRTAVAPDGAHYAYVEVGESANFTVHVVSVANGADQAFQESATAAGFGAQPVIFDYAAEGIYIAEAFEHIWPGLWLFDTKTGSIHHVIDLSVPMVSAGSGIFWYGNLNQADPSPFATRSSAGILPDEIDRLDLRTGIKTRWLYRPGAGVEVLGVDVFGRPLIRSVVPGTDPGIGSPNFFSHRASELMVGLNSTSQRSILKGQIVETLTGPIADSHGVWFGSPQGIYLYTESAGLRKVSNQPGAPANGCF